MNKIPVIVFIAMHVLLFGSSTAQPFSDKAQLINNYLGVPLTVNTKFKIASISKSFTAMLACYHGGGTFGRSAIAVWYPEDKISIIILSNISTLPVRELWLDLEKIVFDKPFKLPELKNIINLSADALKKPEGHYVSESGNMQLEIKADNAHIYAKPGSNPEFGIYAESRLVFFGKKANIRFTFVTNQEEIVTGLTADGRGQHIAFDKK